VACFGTVVNEDNEIDAEYVLGVDRACDGSSWAASLSDKTFRTYSLTPSGLVPGGINRGTEISNVLKYSAVSPSTLYTATRDGKIRTWDLRSPPVAPSGTIAVKLTDEEELLSLDVSINDSLLAASAGNSLMFFDNRSGSNRKLGQYSDCHSDSITSVKFNPSRPNLVASVGEDGLICSYDTSTAASADAVVSILNAECPIRTFFYFGNKSEGICCLSTVETLSCWHFPSAQRLCHFPDIRAQFSLDYLVDGWYDPSVDGVFVLSGRFNGEGLLLGITPAAAMAISPLSSGHTSAIRCCRYSDASSGLPPVLVTGGEDAKLSTWVSSSVDIADSSARVAPRSSAAAARVSSRGFSIRDDPY
jgi:WD40 repeat protein